jgi:hypothetical protein
VNGCPSLICRRGGVFWSNGLVGSITTLALRFSPVIDQAFSRVEQILWPARA